MKTSTRKVLDKSFTLTSYASLALMCLVIVLFLAPIIVNGIGAVVFRATVEHDKFLYETLGRESSGYREELEKSNAARKPLYEMMAHFEKSDNYGHLVEKINAARAQCLSKLESEADIIFAALDIEDSRERLEKVRAIADAAWSPYINEISALADDSLHNGGTLSAAEILKKQSNSLPGAAKLALNSLYEKKKLSFQQKSMLRRNFTSFPMSALAQNLEKLEQANAAYNSFKKGVAELLGPSTAAEKEKLNLLRQKYGQPRENLARDVFEQSVLHISVAEKDAEGRDVVRKVESAEYFKGTPVEEMISYMQKNMPQMMQYHWTVYLGFFFDNPYDSNIFGGIWPMILGTFYLTVGAMLIAAPLGVIAAIYFSEYAKPGRLVSLLRMCVGTLAGVPSIVFGLFGLSFLINTLRVSESKSVLAGAITLALLILPTIIKASEEALKSVPNSFREAALGLGAGKWKSIYSVILPSALPGMLTGIIISMGRAAGETAPIIFTAATSTGAALAVWEVFTQATPALPWNIYNMCSEHEMADKVQHVQYGMVLTLIAIVLTLNMVAILIRAKIQKKLKN